MSNRIITIEREYASGGREVGELVAKQLGIPFYNREILEMASERCGVSVDYLASAEEAAPKSFLYTLMLSSNPTRSIQENLPLSDKVYIIETKYEKDTNALETVRSIFAGKTKDFITAVDEKNIILVKEVKPNEDYADLEKTASVILDMLSSEAMTKVRVAYGLIKEEAPEGTEETAAVPETEGDDE